MVDLDKPSEDSPSDHPQRRLIIIVVTPGEDPEIETDPPESFAAWEMEAALKRAVEIVEEDEFLAAIKEEEDDSD